MICISPANTLSVIVPNTNCGVALYGCEIVAGVPQYKVLTYMNPVATAGSWVTLYTPAAGRTAMISRIVIGNGGSAAGACNLGTGGGGYVINNMTIPAGGFLSWDSYGINIYDGNGVRQ